MADEPDDKNDSGSQPPPPPLADAPPPPLAEAPPPLAAAPPPPVPAAPPAPVPAAPPPAPAAPAAPVAAPARSFFSPLVVLILVVALAAGVVAILYFGGVFERLGGQRTEQTTVPTNVAPVPDAYPGLEDNAFAGEEMGPPPDGLTCNEVYSERDARALPPGEMQTNRLTVTATGDILWNGATIDAVRLRQYLDIVATMAPIPRTIVRVEPGAPLAARSQVGEAISRAMNCNYMPN